MNNKYGICLTWEAPDALVLKEGDDEEGLDLLLHHLSDALVDPHRDIAQHPPVSNITHDI